jgi:site-specific DNA recombinase
LHTKQQVLQAVTGMGLKTKKGAPLTPQTFCQMLRKPIYAGVIDIPKWGIKQSSGAPALVSQETFERVQLLLDGKRPSLKPRNRIHPDFPLRHFVKCGKCDRPLTGSWSKGRGGRYAYYRCQNRACKAVNIRREEMEKRFVDFLGQFQPKQEYLKLFAEIVIDVWKQKKADAKSIHEAALSRIRTIKDHQSRLTHAFVYDRSINQKTYQEERDRLDEELAFAELNEVEVRTDEVDIEAALSLGEFILLNMARLWTELTTEQKQRLQQALFPSGVAIEEGIYRTTHTSLILFNLEAGVFRNEDLVPLTGIEPVF